MRRRFTRVLPATEPTPPQARRGGVAGQRALTVALSLTAHLAILAALLFAHRDSPAPPEVAPIAVQLVQAERPVAEAPEPPAPAPPTPVQPPPPPRQVVRRAPPTPAVQPRYADEGPSGEGVAELSDAQVASAATAGSGPSGGPCDMVRRLQGALRRDSQVQAAVAEARRASGKALFVWNGDWIRSQGQDGNGLAAVREAIMWEVAFAPEACRAEPVRGLVLLSLDDGPSAARLVVGSDRWRWSDLLGRRPGR